jgi:PPOX class probable F420-dependent enzyme
MRPLLDPTVAGHAHAACRLSAAPILWLTTVSADARPHSVPVWFLWTDPHVVVFSRPDTAKVERLRHNPAVSMSLDSAVGGGDIVLAEGDAALVTMDDVAAGLDAFERKYAPLFGGQSFGEWLDLFSQPIQVTATKIISWTATPKGLDYMSVPA